MARLIGGVVLLDLALLDGREWGLRWYDALIGLVVLPAVMVVLGLAARRYADGPVQLTSSVAMVANCVVIAAMVAIPSFAIGTALFYGVTMLVAASRAQPECESTVLSNWILSRDDQIGCPLFSPLDRAEAQFR
jgi:hypothetical protein